MLVVWSELKFKHILISIFLLLPLAVISYLSFVPWERDAIKRDVERQNTVNALARAVEVYMAQNNAYMTNETCGDNWVSKCLRDTQIIDYVPGKIDYKVGGKSCGGENGYCYKTSEDGLKTVIYAELEALANRDYCPENVSYILYSSVEKRTDIVCGEPKAGPQKFVK